MHGAKIQQKIGIAKQFREKVYCRFTLCGSVCLPCVDKSYGFKFRKLFDGVAQHERQRR